MAKVYVVQENNYDFLPAEEFGELTFLSVDKKDDFYNIKNSEHNRNLLAHLRHGLRDFDETQDYLLIAGSPYVSAAVFWLLGQKRTRQLNILRWDNRDRVYIPLHLQLNMEG